MRALAIISLLLVLALEALVPMSSAAAAHRVIAGLLALLMLAMAFVAVRKRRDRFLSFTLLALTVILAWLGLNFADQHSPAVVMGNLVGGFAMLGMLGWMIVRKARPHANASTAVRRWVATTLVLLCIQIALGGLMIANSAASACQSLPDCNGTWLPGSDLRAAFDLTRQPEVDPTGPAIGRPERADIHKLHRIAGALTLATTLVAGFLALRARLTGAAITVIALVTIEFCVGVAAILYDLPIVVAIAHNFVAALLLLGLLRLLALCRNRQALL